MAVEIKGDMRGARRIDKNGWVYLHLEGKPYDRGYQHGYLAAPEIREVLRCLGFLSYWDTGWTWEKLRQSAQDLYTAHLGQEWFEEISGIAAGTRAAGVPVTWPDILTWNAYEELVGYWLPSAKPELPADPPGRCSAFVATGAYTAGGLAVMGHNSWSDFSTGQFSNFVLDIVPASGSRVLMQAPPGYIHSFTDFFVTGSGIMGTETTIGGFSAYDSTKVPEFVRIRQAMQYAKTLDDVVSIMLDGNNGGYANSWLLADSKTREILRLELGLKYHNVERTTNGYYIGFNAAYDPRIRNLECSVNNGFSDIRRHQGARLVRLTQLMEQNKGRIDAAKAQTIMADHYDVYLNKDNPCSRTVDGHYELDAREFMSQPGRPLPFQPRGAMDGKVMDSDMAKQLSFWARWGNSCGLAFDANAFLDRHIQWNYLRGYLKDRPSQPWTMFTAGMAE